MNAEQAPGALANPTFGNGAYPAVQLLARSGESYKILATAARHCIPLQAALGT